MSTEEAFIYSRAKSLAMDVVAEVADDVEVTVKSRLSVSDLLDLGSMYRCTLSWSDASESFVR